MGEWRDQQKADPKFLISSKGVKNNYLEEFFHRVPTSFELYWSSNRITCPKTKSPASSSTGKKIVIGPKMPRVLALFFVFLDISALKHLRINLFALWFLRQRISSNYRMKLSMICRILQISTKAESNNCFIIQSKMIYTLNIAYLIRNSCFYLSAKANSGYKDVFSAADIFQMAFVIHWVVFLLLLLCFWVKGWLFLLPKKCKNVNLLQLHQKQRS